MTKELLRIITIGGLLCVLLLSPMFGDGEASSSIETSEDALFGDSNSESKEDLFIQDVESVTGIQDTLLISEAVDIGGRYTFSAVSSWNWADPSGFFENIFKPTSDSASVSPAATLYFDARPSKDLRIFGKSSISYPFDTQDDSRDFEDVIEIKELFSDFTWNDRVYFRGGKHAINWGVGYFFSPADLLNITEINPEDPDAEPEGPVSLKTHVPINSHNLYLYFIANNIKAVDEIGIAAKSELAFGALELGLGALYMKGAAPAAMLTVSFPIWDVDMFVEAVMKYGSDRTFVEEIPVTLETPFGLNTVTFEEDLFYHATAGFSFMYSSDEMESSVNMTGQYLYNGEGYINQSVLKDNGPGVFALIGAEELNFSDVMNTGLHYAAVSAGWNGILGSDLSLQAFWLQNFSDMSGYVSPSLSIRPFDGLSLSLSTPYRYGDAGDEYTPNGDSLSIQISVNMGGGSF
ncbi:MAG: hypothetical protein HN368_09260 [Spirochaetales bacterium]|jgi:hypothetical protein|nr:hypothetical protein [Spirochaetales bacterium]